MKNKHPEAYLNTTVESGTCEMCSKACKDQMCVGEGSDECTECWPDRVLIPSPSKTGNGTANYGQCVACASNCKIGACAGPKAYQCLACREDMVLAHDKDGPHAGKAYGSCIRCAYTCSRNKCIGEESYHCTECPLGRTLVPADDGKPYGYCAANSVVANDELQKQLRSQAREIKLLKEREKLREDASLGDAKGDTTAKRSSTVPDLSDMERASQEIQKQVSDVETLERSTMFAATTSQRMDEIDLGEGGEDTHRSNDRTGVSVLSLDALDLP